MPYFPENVDNATVQIGQSAELKCTVENLNNYKVKEMASIRIIFGQHIEKLVSVY